LRYNEVHQQLTNDTHTKAEQEITKDIPKSEFGAIPESTNGFFSSLLTRQLSPQESSQSAIISSQQQTTSQTASARSEESAAAGLRNPPDKSKYSSLLPPPSELLLNGLATTNGLPYAKPNNNQSSSNTTSRPIAPRDKLLFDLATQSNGLEENKYDSFKIPKLRYGSNGIPILGGIFTTLINI
jgi:hypothetical protein